MNQASLPLIPIMMLVALGASAPAAESEPNRDLNRPNIILCMADDQGWSEVAYNGHPILKTPVLGRDGSHRFPV